MPNNYTVELTIKNDVAAIGQLSEALESLCKQRGVPAKALAQLQVVLDEIVSNVIKYAWPPGGSHEIAVRMDVVADAVCLEIRDDGRQFDPLATPAPKPPAPGERRRPGGLGIHMVRQLVDDITYTRTDGVNCLVLKKRCTSSAPRGEE